MDSENGVGNHGIADVSESATPACPDCNGAANASKVKANARMAPRNGKVRSPIADNEIIAETSGSSITGRQSVARSFSQDPNRDGSIMLKPAIRQLTPAQYKARQRQNQLLDEKHPGCLVAYIDRWFGETLEREVLFATGDPSEFQCRLLKLDPAVRARVELTQTEEPGSFSAPSFDLA